MCADRVVIRGGGLDLALLGEGQLGDVREPARRAPRELLLVEGRALEEVGELAAIRGIVESELLLPRAGLDLGREYQSGSS
jgi:hypothetical protein